MDFEENRNDYIKHVSELEGRGFLNKDLNMGHYGFIPTSTSYLISLYAIFKSGMNILEVGCGYGNIIRFAKNIGFIATGIEYDDTICEYLEKETNYAYLKQDARTLTKGQIQEYDVVFCYSPINEGRKGFLNGLVDKLKAGQYILLPAFYKDIRGRSDVKQIHGCTFLKV